MKLPSKGAEQSKILPYRDVLFRKFPGIRYRPAAVLVLFYPGADRQLHTVLIERNWYDGVHSGQIAFPGGKMEKNDENLRATALRESEEEIGIPSGEVEIIQQLTPVKVPISRFEVTPYMGFLPRRPSFRPDPSEVQSVLEIPASHLLQSPWQTEMRIFDGDNYKIFYLPFGKHKIWGATAMVIAELRDLFKKAVNFY